ncbi:HK97 family phage prohead protease [Paucibacter sp. DJ1R-11]|uniref:prohead protease/major capsid protein fusion protein n=1 Tax=Paucibacter sp. DJ1R-11 TaxID=2893556 RepID=UPI0021E39732|nr:prohead protease/major capsid protein fusion protein [Paucibacter sp. DJ1R-11]MCV2365538.1 HK97 family phage prohead protease [Paucibacter sp. DJ1R-11]
MSTAVTQQSRSTSPSTEVREIPTQVREASLVPSTFNEADNTVEVVWTTGSRRRAYDWWTETTYEEELAVTAEAVDMTRFDAGVVQVIDSHRVYGGVSAILGVATRGWISGGEGRATLKLSTREEVAGIVADIRAGIIRSISFGYSVERYAITRAQDRTDGVNLPLYRAERWTPQEISFVTVPADPNAGTRSQHSDAGADAGAAHRSSRPGPQGLPCEFVRAASAHNPQEETQMPQRDQVTSPGNAPASPDVSQQQQSRGAVEPQGQAPADLAQRAANAAASAAADITELCARHNVPQLAAGMIRSGQTLEQARGAVLEELARRDAASGGHNATRVETVRDEFATRMEGMQEAVMSRVNARAPLTDNGRQFRGMSIIEMGRELLETHGQNTRGLDKMTLATRILTFRSGGMHSSSDFSSLMANVASKRLRASYEENPGTYTRWARRAPNAPDFKNMSVVQLAAMPDLLQVNEHGEFKYGVLKDGAETYSLLTYGRIVALTRQAIINDDLRAFDRLVTGFGASSARLENRTVYAQLTANAALSDSVALFHATHANLGTGAPSALQFSALSDGRKAMRLQKGLQSEELNLAPSYLIVPASLEQTAYQLTSSNYTPAKQVDVNEFRQGGRTSLEPIVEPILDAASATAWYLAATNSQVDTVEYCYLDGAEGPVIESEVGFEVDGIQFKCREDFAAKAIDYRGLYKANGA